MPEIPKYFEMHKPVLEVLKDGQPHNSKEIHTFIRNYFKLESDCLYELLPSGIPVFSNRASWACTYLKKAGLIKSTARATFAITDIGKKVLADAPPVIDNKFLSQFESFNEFQKRTNSSVQGDTAEDKVYTPDDTFEISFRQINDNLADELLEEVLKLSPIAFEKIVMDLLLKMGYGSFENSSHTTPVTGDEGIDGIIFEDKLGFNLIYIQAKKWKTENSVGRQDVQSFVGAISGKGGSGLFVTTSSFSKPAIEYANQQHIILIDGEKLSKLMIEHNFGVSIKKTFEIKAIDTDVFNEYIEE